MMFLFVILVGALGWLFGLYIGDQFVTVYVLIGAVVYAFFSFMMSSRTALAINGAHQIEKKDNPRLWRIVENLAITEGLPMPKVYIMEDPAPNAFATGINPNKASVAVTTGLLDIMSDAELQGVMAHELGHVKNYDIRVSMIAFALVAVIGIIADIMLRMAWFRDDDDTNQIGFIVGIIGAILAPFAAMLIQMSISRKREYLADATGALITRYPEGLASALEKIAKSGSAMKKQNSSTAHLFFANPLKGKKIASMFSTHPPIEDRVKKLRQLENLS